MGEQALSVTKKRGRPPKEPTVVIRLPAALVQKIDAFAQAHALTRPQAVQAMLEAVKALGGIES